MNATVNILCFKSKTLANGEHPLMICICKNSKRKYISLGVSVAPQYWDFGGPDKTGDKIAVIV